MILGGVNHHCHSHNHLAKFRDLMYKGKSGAVIGYKTRVLA